MMYQSLSAANLAYSLSGEPFNPKGISDNYVKSNLPNDAGDRDFMRLWPSTFDNHPAIGTDTFKMLQSIHF